MQSTSSHETTWCRTVPVANPHPRSVVPHRKEQFVLNENERRAVAALLIPVRTFYSVENTQSAASIPYWPCYHNWVFWTRYLCFISLHLSADHSLVAHFLPGLDYLCYSSCWRKYRWVRKKERKKARHQSLLLQSSKKAWITQTMQLAFGVKIHYQQNWSVGPPCCGPDFLEWKATLTLDRFDILHPLAFVLWTWRMSSRTILPLEDCVQFPWKALLM